MGGAEHGRVLWGVGHVPRHRFLPIEVRYDGDLIRDDRIRGENSRVRAVPYDQEAGFHPPVRGICGQAYWDCAEGSHADPRSEWQRTGGSWDVAREPSG